MTDKIDARAIDRILLSELIQHIRKLARRQRELIRRQRDATNLRSCANCLIIPIPYASKNMCSSPPAPCSRKTTGNFSVGRSLVSRWLRRADWARLGHGNVPIAIRLLRG